MTERHVETIEGQPTLVVKRRPPLPSKMTGLLGELRFVWFRQDITPAGARASCEQRKHRFLRFREGRHIGRDAVVRDVRLEMCADCGAVCVRDISYDLAIDGERVPTGRSGPRRRDEVLGWYSGARRNGREFK